DLADLDQRRGLLEDPRQAVQILDENGHRCLVHGQRHGVKPSRSGARSSRMSARSALGPDLRRRGPWGMRGRATLAEPRGRGNRPRRDLKDTRGPEYLKLGLAG